MLGLWVPGWSRLQGAGWKLCWLEGARHGLRDAADYEVHAPELVNSGKPIKSERGADAADGGGSNKSLGAQQ